MTVWETRKPRVLVLTAPVDPTADLVLRHLEAEGVPFLRIDTAQFPTDLVFSGEISAGRGWRSSIDGTNLDDITAIYYRRPGRFVFDTTIPAEMISWCDGQARYGLWGVLESLPVTWVNSPPRDTRPSTSPGNSPTPTPSGCRFHRR